MKLVTKEILKKLPKLYSQENEKDPIAQVKFFDPTGSWEWYGIEAEQQENGDLLFFGLVKGLESELGYFTLNDLVTAKEGIKGLKASPIERDLHFKPCAISQIE